MMITLYEVKTGNAIQREPVDAREILRTSPDLYSAEPAAGSAGEEKTAAQLRASLDAKGIAYTKHASKAELQALDAAPAA